MHQAAFATRYAAFHIPFEWAAIADIKSASLGVALHAIGAVLAERERRQGAADPILHKQLQARLDAAKAARAPEHPLSIP